MAVIPTVQIVEVSTAGKDGLYVAITACAYVTKWDPNPTDTLI